MVAIGRALMSQPEILMLDEPSLGLSPVLTKELFRSLARIAETGVGILLVEQNARQSLKIASRGYLIEVGRITGENSAQNLMTDPAVVSAYLGGAVKRPAARPIRLPGAVQAAGRSRLHRPLHVGARLARRRDPAGFRAHAAPGRGPAERLRRPLRPGEGRRPVGRTRRAPPAAAAGKPDSGERRQAPPPTMAADLARAAASRHARHIRALRASRENPSAFAGLYDPATALIVARSARSPRSCARRRRPLGRSRSPPARRAADAERLRPRRDRACRAAGGAGQSRPQQPRRRYRCRGSAGGRRRRRQRDRSTSMRWSRARHRSIRRMSRSAANSRSRT